MGTIKRRHSEYVPYSVSLNYTYFRPQLHEALIVFADADFVHYVRRSDLISLHSVHSQSCHCLIYIMANANDPYRDLQMWRGKCSRIISPILYIRRILI